MSIIGTSELPPYTSWATSKLRVDPQTSSNAISLFLSWFLSLSPHYLLQVLKGGFWILKSLGNCPASELGCMPANRELHVKLVLFRGPKRENTGKWPKKRQTKAAEVAEREKLIKGGLDIIFIEEKSISEASRQTGIPISTLKGWEKGQQEWHTAHREEQLLTLEEEAAIVA
ncbi:hypothetical protein B0J17DRAFT_632990 [Rhizoctonia solani]|nr:hypothetical protein B0J17DRAFT_632990 [Rhizoctonia solani]